MKQESKDMLSRGAVTKVTDPEKLGGYHSHYFLVPKGTGGSRPILKLEPFNKFVRKYKFTLIKTASLLSIVRRSD